VLFLVFCSALMRNNLKSTVFETSKREKTVVMSTDRAVYVVYRVYRCVWYRR